MGPEQTSNVAFPAPVHLAKAAKIDAVRRGLTVKDWWREAGERLLAERERETAEVAS